MVERLRAEAVVAVVAGEAAVVVMNRHRAKERREVVDAEVFLEAKG